MKFRWEQRAISQFLKYLVLKSRDVGDIDVNETVKETWLRYLRYQKYLLGLDFLMVLIVASLSACSHLVVVKSEPSGARVRIVNENGKPGPSLGVTPLDLNSLPNSDAVVLEIDKEAHLPKQIVVPKATGSRLTISTKLQPLSKEYLAERSRVDFAASLNANLFEIFKLQSLVLEKNSAEVMKMEITMREQWEGISLFHSLLGNFYYLTGDYKKAKNKYEKALSLDPRNDEARNMLSNLR